MEIHIADVLRSADRHGQCPVVDVDHGTALRIRAGHVVSIAGLAEAGDHDRKVEHLVPGYEIQGGTVPERRALPVPAERIDSFVADRRQAMEAGGDDVACEIDSTHQHRVHLTGCDEIHCTYSGDIA